jgi:hypothetical protein
VSSCVRRVVLDDLALFDDPPDFHATDHPVWPQRLLQRMGKKQYSPCCGSPYSVQDSASLLHGSILTAKLEDLICVNRTFGRRRRSTRSRAGLPGTSS